MQAIEMQVKITDKHEVCVKLPDNIKQDFVKIIIMYDVEEKGTQKKRQFGQFKGKIEISADFDDDLPDDFWLGGAS